MSAGCCRTITAQLDQVEEAQSCLRTGDTTKEKVGAVHRTLNVLRRIFGSYKVDSNLTSAFRQDLEPALDNVWTPEDLEDYRQRLHSFSQKVEGSLHQWRRKYCKEGVVATS